MKSVAIFFGGAFSLAAVAAAFIFYQSRVHTYKPDPEFERSMAKSELRSTAQEIEVYRLVFGRLPESLQKMRGGSSYYDSYTQSCTCGESSDFYYQLAEDHESYQLFSKGPDCKPYTTDDVAPEFTDQERSRIRLRGGAPKVVSANLNQTKCDGA